eukprot:COSAG06_NODE_17313_length_948_cov_1.787986_2_plen_86_part_00
MAGEYICGIEPGNASMLGRQYHRENGLLETLRPFERRSFSIEIGVVEGKTALDGLLREGAGSTAQQRPHGPAAGAGGRGQSMPRL